MLIDATYFIGELAIANRDKASVIASINLFIQKYEAKYLRMVMGETIYADYLAGIEEDPIPAKWTDLQNVIRVASTKDSPIAGYVYWWYMRDQASQTVGMGQVKPLAENAIMVSNIDKMTRAWNEMVDQTKVVAKFLFDNQDTYGNYPYAPFDWTDAPVFEYHVSSIGYVCYPEIFHKKNSLGL